MRLIDADKLIANHTERISYKNSWHETEEDEFVAVKNIQDAPTALQWIPCSERLPEESDYYLVTFDSITHPVGIFFFEAQYGGCWVDEMGNGLKSKFFVAWMPLPKPYEEVKQ